MHVTTFAAAGEKLALILSAQATPGGTSDPAAVQVQSIWDFILKGGPVMIPIGICSFVALTVIVERLVSLRRGRVVPPDFLPGLTALVNRGPSARDEALAYCRRSDAPVAPVFAAAVKHMGEPIELTEKHIAEAGERLVMRLRQYLRLLSVIAAIAPLLGLLGTIFGMINAFQTVAASAEALGRTELLARGIYEAMITTAAGLMVAIPVLIAFHALSAKIDRLVMEIDDMTVDFVENLPRTTEPKSSSVRQVPVSPESPGGAVHRAPGAVVRLEDNGSGQVVESGAGDGGHRGGRTSVGSTAT